MNDDIETFIDRHSVEKLLDFLPHLVDYIEGETNARIVAQKMDVDPLESEIVLQYLRNRFKTE